MEFATFVNWETGKLERIRFPSEPLSRPVRSLASCTLVVAYRFVVTRRSVSSIPLLCPQLSNDTRPPRFDAGVSLEPELT